jgi:hypothetical protein
MGCSDEGGGSSNYRLPKKAPSPVDIESRERFDKLVEASLEQVRSSAERWRGGLAALVTLVTGGLLIKGPDAAADLKTTWRVILTVLAGSGIAAAIYGLWQALKAAAGAPKTEDLDKIIATYGSVAFYESVQAKRAADALRRARGALMVSLPLLGAALVAWWWAGAKAPSPPAYVEVDTAKSSICGTLKSGDNGHLRVQVGGEERPRVISFAKVKNIKLKSSC